MHQVDHYMRQAKAARALAKAAKTQTTRSQFEEIAEGWEKLARERLAFLESKAETRNGNAAMDGTVQSMRRDSIRLDG
jgi:hypothetical protein